MFFHVLDNLHLFGIKFEPPFFGRSINLFPFGERKEDIFPTEAPYHDVVFPVAFEYRSEYQDEGIVLYASDVKECEPLKDEMVYFN